VQRQIIWNSAVNPADKKAVKIEYMPIYKLGVNYDVEIKSMAIGAYDWATAQDIDPHYTQVYGVYKGNDLEILYVRRPTAEPFFPIPDYLSGIIKVRGELANAAQNTLKLSYGYDYYKL
jgi:hypothetical protein